MYFRRALEARHRASGAVVRHQGLAGEPLELCPERAIYWPRRRKLLVADPHFGKAAACRAQGVNVPRGSTLEGVARLDRLLGATRATSLVFLGDFLHAREGRTDSTFAALAAWRASHGEIAMQIVRGNHDRRAGIHRRPWASTA